MTGLSIPFTGLKKQYHNLREEILDVTDLVLRSGQIMNGNWTVEFEHWLAQRNHVRHAITCHSGTQALEIIASYVAANRPSAGPNTVLVPTVSYPATVNAFMRNGWDVHFIDVDRYGIIDTERIPQSSSYDAVCMVGLYGASVVRLCRNKFWRGVSIGAVPVIEDAAQHWLSASSERVGDAAISFDPTKNLGNYGNGGAVITNDSDLADWAHNWRDNGRPSTWAFDGITTNSRMSEVDCAQMMIKTRYVDQWQQRREAIARHWLDRLQGSSVRALIDHTNFNDHSFHKFVVELDHRDRVQRQMTVRRIETRVHYAKPLHELPSYRHLRGPDLLCNGSALSRRVLSLPIYPELTDLEVEYIIDQLLDCVEEMHS